MFARRSHRGLIASLALGLTGILVNSAAAQSVAEFYKGKSITIVVSASAGGGYDTIARVVSRHLSRHMPGNPAIIIQNMPGAGGLRAPNYLYNVAERSGATVGLMQNSIPFEPLVGNKNAQFDPTKFGWLGSPNYETGVLMVWATAPATTVHALCEQEILVGVEAIASNPAFSARLLTEALGLKLKLVPGYRGSTQALLAMERGEVHSFPNFFNSMMAQRPHWLKERKIVIPVKWGPVNEPALPDVPYAEDLVDDPDKKALLRAASASLALGRPFMTPPEVPADRLKVLQGAFYATFRDAEFSADAKKVGFNDPVPQSGDALEKVIKDIYAAPRELIDSLRYILTGEKQ